MVSPCFRSLQQAGLTSCKWGPGTYDVGLPQLPAITARQECPQWCWAASIQTIFGAWGYDVRQEALARFIFGNAQNGGLYCSPASDEQILNAVSQTFQYEDCRSFKGSYFVMKGRGTHPQDEFWWSGMLVEFWNRRPLLAAYQTSSTTGHAVVLTHMRFRVNPDGSRDALAITARDPWPDSPNRRFLTLQEVTNMGFVAAAFVKRVA